MREALQALAVWRSLAGAERMPAISLGRLAHVEGARVERVNEATSRVKAIMLDAPGWQGCCAGQYVAVRLTDHGGYQTERAYALRPGGPPGAQHRAEPRRGRLPVRD